MPLQRFKGRFVSRAELSVLLAKQEAEERGLAVVPLNPLA
jgi:hypothetical protein